jgi:hypothetical protein
MEATIKQRRVSPWPGLLLQEMLVILKLAGQDAEENLHPELDANIMEMLNSSSCLLWTVYLLSDLASFHSPLAACRAFSKPPGHSARPTTTN